jgi:hypothetical protein
MATSVSQSNHLVDDWHPGTQVLQEMIESMTGTFDRSNQWIMG